MSDVVDDLESSYRTELSRLGSSKALYAATGGEMENDVLLDVLAAKAAASHNAVATWADDGGPHADLFADAAGTFAAQLDDLEDRGGAPDGDPGPVYDAMATLDTPPERLGGLLGHAIVSRALLDQVVGFFVGNADPGAADDFRTVRDAATDRVERAADALEALDGADRDVATVAAERVVEAAYEDYVDRLEAMGVNPKPVC
jgi:hypothetical protein